MNDWYTDIKLPRLQMGRHTSPRDGLCAMEMVAFIERLPHSDSPPCTCPVIAAYVRVINDAMGTAERQQLLPYLPRLVDTVAPQYEQQRGEYLAWQSIRVFVPLALRASGLHTDADRLAHFDAALGLRAALHACADASTHADTSTHAAAHAAPAAHAATRAAHAAHAAARAAHAPVIDAMLAALDGVLAIGPQSRGFTQPARVHELGRLTVEA